jgi:Sulfatase-modifying factor enzyme 1
MEYAARGGLKGKTYAWGDEFKPGGKAQANTWEGEFPVTNTRADGFDRAAPVGCFPANGYGLYDMTGNVWEWTTSQYDGTQKNAPVSRVLRVIKGGSFLCYRTTVGGTGLRHGNPKRPASARSIWGSGPLRTHRRWRHSHHADPAARQSTAERDGKPDRYRRDRGADRGRAWADRARTACHRHLPSVRSRRIFCREGGDAVPGQCRRSGECNRSGYAALPQPQCWPFGGRFLGSAISRLCPDGWLWS